MSHRYFRSIVFDLDGTLVDSFPGIVESMRHAVSVIDPPLDLSDLRSQIGPPLPKMLSRMWPELAEDVRASVLSEFRSDYSKRGYMFSVAYTGIPEALHQFRSLGITLFVLTNKPEAPTRKILSHLGLETHFTQILSPDSMTPPLSTKSDGALYLAKKHELVANETLVVGDSPDDLKAARAAGFSFVEASYGYGNFDEIVTDEAWFRLKSPSDLAKLIN